MHMEALFKVCDDCQKTEIFHFLIQIYMSCITVYTKVFQSYNFALDDCFVTPSETDFKVPAKSQIWTKICVSGQKWSDFFRVLRRQVRM